MIQRLPIALAQVKTIYTSKNFINDLRKLVYSMYRAKEVTKNVYNNNEFNKIIEYDECYIYEF